MLLTGARGRPSCRPSARYPVWSGASRRIKGWLGAFEVEWEQANPIDLDLCTRCNACIRVCPEQAIDYSYQIDLDKCKAPPQVRGGLRRRSSAIDFERADAAPQRALRPRARSAATGRCSTLHQPPQGYFAPGGDPLAQARAVRELAQLTGEFEKPKFFDYKEKICAHSRSEIDRLHAAASTCARRARSRATSTENRVEVEPHLCMGCGACATVCPSGAMTYAYPRVADMGARLKTAAADLPRRRAATTRACCSTARATGAS